MATKSKKSSTAIKSKESVLPKRERSSAGSKKRSVSINEDDFAYLFRKLCLEYETKINPVIRTVQKEPSVGDFTTVMPLMDSSTLLSFTEKSSERTVHIPEVLITYNDVYLQSAFFKHFQVCSNMLRALKKTLKIYNHLTINILKLEFCSLSHKEVQVLYTILKDHETIEELSVNGNPNRFENHHLLLKGNKVKMLSMRFCQISEKGIKKIAANIDEGSQLIYLNLSSNYISDDGLVYLADSLRCNRSILSLNLADNCITDEGCTKIMSVLQKFPLYHEEIVLRRHRRMEYLLKKRELSRMLLQQSSSLMSSSNKLKGSQSGSARRKSSRSLSDTRSSASLSKQKVSRSELESRLKLTEDTHPFVKDSYEENKEIYCKGNLVLRQLNLAYNQITSVGLRAIIECMQYQYNFVESVRQGLTRIELEGNTFSTSCSEMNEVLELIAQRFERRRSVDSARNSKRRSLSGYSVRLSLPN